MGTTSLIVELLVGGIQVATWLLLLVIWVFGISTVPPLVESNAVAVGVIATAWCYAIGVVFDRVWDTLLKPIDRSARRKVFVNNKAVHRARREVFADASRAEYVDYVRSRLRIARSAACNLVILTVVVSGFMWCRVPSWVLWLWIPFLGGLLSAVAWLGFIKLSRTYYAVLSHMAMPVEGRGANGP